MINLIHTAAASAILGLALPAVAAEAGAWETFFDKHNTEAWYVYDYSDGLDYLPVWDGEQEGDEYAYFSYVGDMGLIFVADERVGEGALIGDYPAERIAGVAADVYIEDLATLDYVECRLLADGPSGRRDYHSAAFFQADFDDGGWWSLYFGFEWPWFSYEDGKWVEVDATTLTNVGEIQFAFVPVVGSVGGSEVGLDDVTLEPTLEAPPLYTSVSAGPPAQFRLAFTPGPGLECRVEKMLMTPAGGWDTVIGETEIKGPAEHFYQIPVGPAAEIFRVGADPFYTMVFTP